MESAVSGASRFLFLVIRSPAREKTRSLGAEDPGIIFQLMEIPPPEDIRSERGLRSGEVALQFNLPGSPSRPLWGSYLEGNPGRVGVELGSRSWYMELLYIDFPLQTTRLHLTATTVSYILSHRCAGIDSH
jgi:hypothetical protein